MKKLIIETKRPKQVVDVTERINDIIQKNGVEDGVVSLFLTHTTAALTTADLDPGTDQDMLDVFDKIIPRVQFRHPHNPSHVPNHILSSLIGASLSLIVENRQLVLGTWQRVVLLEFDGPRKREIMIQW